MTRSVVVLAAVLLVCPSAHAIINPFFTPKELTEQADVIYVGTVAAAGKDWTFSITQTLKGKPAKKHVISLAKCKAANAADIAALFKEKGRQTFILFSGTMKRAREEEAQESTFAQLEKAWLKLRAAGDGRWEVLDYAPGLGATWAAGSDMLVPMCRYILKDPDPTVPISAGVRWADDPSKAGTVKGNSAGMEGIGLGAKRTIHLFVSSDQGDRLLRPTTKDFETTFSDATAASGLDTKSLRYLWLDVNRDGMADLLSWGSQGLVVRLVTAGAKFKAAGAAWTVKSDAACTGLAPCSVGGRPAVVVSSQGAPELLVADGGGWKKQPLPDADDAGNLGGGPCVVADFDLDGRPDVLLPGAANGLLWRGTADGFAKPTRIAVSTGGGTGKAALGDFNADGALDFMLAGNDANRLWENDGKAAFKDVFRLGGSVSYKCPAGSADVRTMDLNHDGRQDLFFIYRGGALMYHFNRGYRCLGEEGEVSLPGTELDGGRRIGLRAIAAGDFDDANSEDLAVLLATGDVLVYMNNMMDMPAVRLRLPKGVTGPVTASVWQGDDFPVSMGTVSVVGHSPAAYVAVRAAGPTTVKWTVPGKGVQSRTVEPEDKAVDVILKAK